jgi:RecJ-like exonuclease
MESLNIGARVYELFEMSKELEEMRDDLKRMELHNANNIVTDKGSTEEDKNSLPN